MPRTVRDAKIETRQARLRLRPRKEPYWRGDHGGLPYRLLPWGLGRLVVRPLSRSGRRRLSVEAIGEADDINDADGSAFLSYKHAFDLAQAWFAEKRAPPPPEPPPAPYVVNDAANDYLVAYEAGQTKGGGKAKGETKSTIGAFIRPTLGTRVVGELTTEELQKWLREIAGKPPAEA
jgi:hypothetical protein